MFEQVADDVLSSYCSAHPEFRRLYDHHRKLNRRIDAAESGTEGLSDDHLAELKKDRLHTKEAMVRHWDAHHLH